MIFGTGAGVNFGPDVASRFLELNNLKMVVRSHEVCRTGFELPFSGDDQQKVATIFSASNYSGGGNSAAYMTFSVTGPTTRDMNAVRVPGCDLQYRVYYFHIDHDDEELFSTQPNYTLSLHQLVSSFVYYFSFIQFRPISSAATAYVSLLTTNKISQF